MKTSWIKIFIVSCWVFSSCTGLRLIPPSEKLYTGASVEFMTENKLKDKNDIEDDIKSVIKPKPNKKFLWMRPKMWMFLVAGNPEKKKGFRAWLKKTGEPPVYLSNTDPGATSKYIDAALFNNGVFRSSTDPEIKEHKRTAEINYRCYVHQPFVLGNINYPTDDDLMSELIRNNSKESLLKSGERYQLEILESERERIDAIMKNNGYFFFSPDYILFEADTNQQNQTINLKLTIKEEAPYEALLIYRIGKVTVTTGQDPLFRDEERPVQQDTTVVDSVYFTGRRQTVRSSVLLRSIFIRNDNIYSRENHNITLNRLMSLGSYKFVSIRFKENDTLYPGFLDAQILLNPMPKRTFRAETDIVTKSNDFTGPRLNINYKNRNTFNGAEILSLDLGYSFETQLSGKYANLFSYTITPAAELIIPGFVTPFNIRNKRSIYMPKTRISVSYNYNKRVGYFNLITLKSAFGYKWKEDIKKEHELLPVNINFTRLSKLTPEFNALLEENPLLKRSYDEQFIAGVSYTFTFNEQVIENQKSQFYFSGNTELSGNTLSLFNKITTGKSPDADNPSTVAGAVYSQFARFTADFRNYLNFRNKNRFVARLYSGLGIPYGNSSTLPYIKQFFSGGPNSLRAFLINSVGPGTYYLRQESGSQLTFLNQGGDVKVEGNIEYRFNMISILKGALFTDAGNTWLLDGQLLDGAGPFRFNKIFSEAAVGSGFGLRIDASFFVLRFDFATPLRKPWTEEKWVFNQMKPSSRDWRRENLILNIAIGYPF